MADITLRPLRVGEMIDTVFRILFRRVLAFAAVTATFALGFVVAGLLLAVSRALGVVALIAVGLAAASILPGAYTRIAAAVFLDTSERWSESLSHASSKWVSMLGALLLIMLMGTGLNIASIPFASTNNSFVIFGVLAVFIFVYLGWLTAPSAIIVEGARAGESIGRSWNLMRGRRWAALGVLTIIGIIALLVFMAALAVVGALYGDELGLGIFAVILIGYFVYYIVMWPVLSILGAVAYFDARVRKEAFDLELLASSVSIESDDPMRPHSDDGGATPGPW